MLGKTGIKVMSKKALDVLQEAGAKVDYEKKRATIPANVVEEALKVAPKTITYGARDPGHDFLLNKLEAHFCVVGMPPFVLDIETGSRRNVSE